MQQILAVVTLAVLAALLGLLFIRPRRRRSRFVPVGLLARRYVVWLPIPRKQPMPVPILLAFHGEGSTVEVLERDCALHTARQAARFAIVYPEGYHGTWNAGRCCGDAARSNINEVKFVRAILKDVSSLLTIDRQRIYATGFSNGAMLCYYLACNMSDEIAAIAPVNGSMSVDHCAPTRPIAIFHIHGDEGMAVEDREGPASDGPSAATASIAFWCGINRLDRESKIDAFNGCACCAIYSGDSDEPKIRFCVVSGLGHRWPGAGVAGSAEPRTSNAISEPMINRNDVNDAILQFLGEYHLPEARPRRIRIATETAMPRKPDPAAATRLSDTPTRRD